ncbi:MAG: transporter substrate-binding domain-containing protein [Pseudomonadales bacterium]|nr:transporter substrate-binding domain-containing protein [Pseudomonadales bacterium]
MMIVSFMMAISSGLYAQSILTLSTADITSSYFHTDDYQGLVDKILSKALARIGYEFKVITLPAERSLMMADSGVVDGELVRTRSIEQRFPDLIRVPEAVVAVDFVVFSYKPIDLNNGWLAFKGKSVGLVIGMKIIEQSVPEKALVTRVKNSKQLFNLLKNRKVDYVVFTRDMGEGYLRHNSIPGVFSSSTVLSSVPGFTYINRDNAHLVPKLARTLREMKQDGSYQEIVATHMRSYNVD